MPNKAGADTVRDFDTSHLLNDLKGKSVRGGATVAAGQMVNLLMRFGSMAVMARLLQPADFGLVAMVYPINSFAQMLTDAGLSAATVQRAKLSDAQVSAVFWLNILLGTIATIAVCAAAPLVAWFYGDDRLLAITLVMSSILLVTSVELQHAALLNRQMDFRKLAIRQVVACALSLIAGIVAALAGMGYWALVVASLTEALARTILTVSVSGWRPKWVLRGTGVRPMLSFGANMTASRFLDFFRNDISRVLIGWAWGATALGYFNRAMGLQVQPTTQILGPIATVVTPALSALQHEPERYRRYFRRGMSLVAFLWTPLVVCMLITAEEVVMVMLGPQWEAVVPIYLALGPSVLFTALALGTGWACVPIGRADRMRRWKVVSMVVTLTSICVALRWGMVGVAAAYSGCITVLLIPAIIYCSRGTPVRLRDHLVPVWRPLVAALCAGAIVWLAKHQWQGALERMTLGLGAHATVRSLITLIVVAVFYGPLYLTILSVIPKGYRSVADVFALIHEFKLRRSTAAIDHQTVVAAE